eukprot:TRINITY_DN51903_c0_g1_i1.p1 TRINITY_DN51903_c0_g1~~TRINITY_DN51903_c0_g1_i1.p1  ORF type:complete len:213 (-),score=38.38 TRINITY_DN51903_c0_g1_i1:79-717(-)
MAMLAASMRLMLRSRTATTRWLAQSPARLEPRSQFLSKRWHAAAAVRVIAVLEDDTELPALVAEEGDTLMELLSRSDVGDVWSDAGACGGACMCSTCRVVIEPRWRHDTCSAMPAPADEEMDMLEKAAEEFSHQGSKPWERNVMQKVPANDSGRAGSVDSNETDRQLLIEEFLDGARLSCQINLTKELDGLRVKLVGIGPNMMEVPLWMRSR